MKNKIELLTVNDKKVLETAISSNTSEINKTKTNIEVLEEEVQRLTSGGIPKLQSYSYVLTATSSGQKDFTIPLSTFDKTTDTVIVVQNRTTLNETDYSITDKTLTLVEGVGVGTEISLMVLKNVPVGEDGSINGNVLAVNTMDGNRVKDGSLSYSKIKESVGQNLLQNSTFTQGFSFWTKTVSGAESWNTSQGMLHVGHCAYSQFPSVNAFLTQTISAIEGRGLPFVFSLEVQGKGAYFVEYFKEDGSSVGNTEVKTFSESTYKKLNVGGVIPSTCTEIKVSLRADANNITFFKNLKLEMSEIATPYTNEGDIYMLGNVVEYNATTLNGFSSPFTVRKVGKTVTINGEMARQSDFPNQPTIPLDLFVLPSEFKPKATSFGTAWAITENYTNTEVFRVRIKPDGLVTLESCKPLGSAVNNNYYLTINATFPTK